jgi:hypothetical protein
MQCQVLSIEGLIKTKAAEEKRMWINKQLEALQETEKEK